MKQMMAVVVAAVAFAAPAAAQNVAPVYAARADTEKLQTELARVAVESRVTKGAPYSAEMITETTQVLADGNRISRKTAARIYRDSEGRTRRESLSAAGEVTSISISDPVGESTYLLDPNTRIAHRNGVIMLSPSGGSAGATVSDDGRGVVIATRSPEGLPRVFAGDPNSDAAAKAGAEIKAAGARGRSGGSGAGGGSAAGGGGTTVIGVEGSALAGGGFGTGRGAVIADGAGKREDLGQQVIEGVVATGTRSTNVIQAGAIGNARAINIVSEQWFSEDLKVLVLTRHSDPRMGETTYKLVNVTQGEPSPALFQVPADYTLKDSVIRRRTPLQ